jgi:hypothetical protein
MDVSRLLAFTLLEVSMLARSLTISALAAAFALVAVPAVADDAMGGHKVFALAAQNGSGEIGTVTLTPLGMKTRVEVALVGTPDGVAQPDHTRVPATSSIRSRNTASRTSWTAPRRPWSTSRCRRSRPADSPSTYTSRSPISRRTLPAGASPPSKDLYGRPAPLNSGKMGGCPLPI